MTSTIARRLYKKIAKRVILVRRLRGVPEVGLANQFALYSAIKDAIAAERDAEIHGVQVKYDNVLAVAYDEFDKIEHKAE